MRRSKSGREAGGQARHIEPGTPWENGYAESFNGKVRGEVLNAGGVTPLLEAQVPWAGWNATAIPRGPTARWVP